MRPVLVKIARLVAAAVVTAAAAVVVAVAAIVAAAAAENVAAAVAAAIANRRLPVMLGRGRGYLPRGDYFRQTNLPGFKIPFGSRPCLIL